MIKVIIVDDHALVRMGIKRLLADVSTIKVIDEAESGEELLKIAREKNPDVVLLDVKMPGIGGLEATRRLVRSNDSIKIIALSAFHEEPFPTRILQAGAAGYLTKECGLDEMVTAIEKVHAGERYISPEVAQKIALKSLSDTPGDTSPFDILSERELQIFLMITGGMSVSEISEKLHLSPKTVNSYRYRLFEKLKTRNDVELTHLAMRHHLLDKNQLSENQLSESQPDTLIDSNESIEE